MLWLSRAELVGDVFLLCSSPSSFPPPILLHPEGFPTCCFGKPSHLLFLIPRYFISWKSMGNIVTLSTHFLSSQKHFTQKAYFKCTFKKIIIWRTHTKQTSLCLPTLFSLSTRCPQKHPPCLGLSDPRDFWQEEGIWGVSLHVRSQPTGVYTDTFFFFSYFFFYFRSKCGLLCNTTMTLAAIRSQNVALHG